MTLNTAHTGQAPVSEERLKARILVLGPAAKQFASALFRLDANTAICAAETVAEAVELLKTNQFDHVLVDNRTDGPAVSLAIPRIAELDIVGKLTVLTSAHSKDEIAGIHGVDCVIEAPYNPIEIAKSLEIAVTDSRGRGDTDNGKRRRASDAQNDSDVSTETTESTEATAEDTDEEMRPFFIRAISAVAHFIPGLTPVISMIYKNTALTMLTALFIAFISYGLMIVFFLTSGNWSSPLQLQRGHELVIKAERELGELKVKRNLVTEKLSNAEHDVNSGQASLDRATMLQTIIGTTIDQEINKLTKSRGTLSSEIDQLRGLVASFGNGNERQKQRKRLEKAWKNRVITRDSYQNSMLNISKVEETLLVMGEKLASKEYLLGNSVKAVTYLEHLQLHLTNADEAQFMVQGITEYIPLTNQVIEVKELVSNGSSTLNQAMLAIDNLQNSSKVLETSISELEKTPMIAALKEPVNVLFVPYDNISSYQQGAKLYTCAFTLFWCSNVGTVGAPIGGEITTTHPFFGKPIRGQFVQANLTEKSAAQEEIIHVGRPLFIF